ncbi:MAG: hypothetical protein HW416_1022, partial [Chloroflexi bacterium]|nr:hypothetical protein [Chloroflexota bacterium]
MARPASIGPVDAAGAEILNRMVRRIVRSVKPLRVILFGSQARGDAHQGSDVDLLIVVPDDANKKLAWRRARAAVDGAWGAGCDILVATPADIMRRGNLVGDVLRPALREGHVVYDAPGMAERNRELEAGPVTEDERLGATRQWMRLARADLMTAEMAVQRPDIDPYPPSYLSQQSAEKALKAILVFLQLDYPLTHDLDRVRGSIPDDW